MNNIFFLLKWEKFSSWIWNAFLFCVFLFGFASSVFFIGFGRIFFYLFMGFCSQREMFNCLVVVWMLLKHCYCMFCMHIFIGMGCEDGFENRCVFGGCLVNERDNASCASVQTAMICVEMHRYYCYCFVQRVWLWLLVALVRGAQFCIGFMCVWLCVLGVCPVHGVNYWSGDFLGFYQNLWDFRDF